MITGGLGFIGSRLSSYLMSKGHEVGILDNLHPQVHVPGQVEPVRDAPLYIGDVRDKDLLIQCLRQFRPEVVVHLAAETGTGQSLAEPGRHIGVNGLGTARLVEAFRDARAELASVVLASSRAVYGEGMWRGRDGRLFFPDARSRQSLDAGMFDVLDKGGAGAEFVPHGAPGYMPNPSSVYGASKLLQEYLLRSYSGDIGVPLAILRFQNVYGTGQAAGNPYTGIVVLFDKLARSKERIPVYEDGQILRDFVHVSDVTKIIARAGTLGASGVYDVGSGSPTTVQELAKHIAAIHAAPEPVVTGQYRIGDVRCAYASLAATQRDLDYKVLVDLPTGLREVADGVELNP